MAGLVGEPVKVVIINTEYVETDARSFKTVVQKLTGKDSAPPGNGDKRLNRGLSRKLASMDQISAKRVRLDVDDKVSYASANPVLMRDLSFKEFERLLQEMPFMDELHRLRADI